jgi:hypothetical protein
MIDLISNALVSSRAKVDLVSSATLPEGLIRYSSPSNFSLSVLSLTTSTLTFFFPSSALFSFVMKGPPSNVWEISKSFWN